MANGSRRCKSVISANQWEADSHVLFGVVRELMLIYVRDHSDMVGTRQTKVIFQIFCATICMVVWYYF